MENKELKVLLSKTMARRWYESDDEQLKVLALSVYTKEELEELTIEDITTNVQETYPELWDKMASMNYIQIVAKYFNGNWKKKDNELGYFYTFDKDVSTFVIREHNTVTYPGIVYYKDKNTAKKAFEYLYEHYDNIV